MKIIPLGIGSAGTIKDFQTNFVLEHNGKRMLIDCGSRVALAMKEQDLGYLDIDAIYISHLHADHAGGLEDFSFTSYFTPGHKRSIKLIGHHDVINDGWDKTWRGGHESIQGSCLSLDDYYEVNRVADNGNFLWQGIRFEVVQSIHIMNKFKLVPSYGLMIYDPDSTRVVYITTDTQYAPSQIATFYGMADVIIHDFESSPFPSGVHANAKNMPDLESAHKSKMALCHYNDNVLADFDTWNEKVKAWGFRGLCRRGENVLDMFE